MLLAPLAGLAAYSGKPLEVYVSPGGRDESEGTSKAPYATLERVRARLIEFAKTPGRTSVVVHLRGTFHLSSTLELGPEANGVRFVGPAVISGGLELRDWTETTFNGHPAWSAAAPAGVNFRELFIGDFRAPRPRLPKTGFFAFSADAPAKPAGQWMDGDTAMQFRPGDLRADWRNLGDVEIVAHHLWVTSRLPVAAIDGNVVRFTKKSVFWLHDDHGAGRAPYVVENVAEAMEEPGEWYLDRPSSKVYYLARPGERRDRFVAVAPRVTTLIHLKNAKGASFEKLAFRDTEWALPAESSGDVQAAFSVPGALRFTGDEDTVVKNCQVEHLGGYGVAIDGPSKGCRVEHNTLRDLGAGGVKVDDGSQSNVVSDNVIESGGRVFASAVGILIKLSGGNEIVHNRIRDFYYTGISVGWSWGFADTPAHDNHIAYNEISEIGQDQLSDMGGIYVLGKQPGSHMDHNRIRNVSARGYGGWGIYFDEGSTGWTVEDNVVVGTKTGGFHIHYGRDNVIRNNIFAYAQREGQLIRSRDDQQGPIRFEHNLVVARPGDAPLVVPSWLKRDVTMVGNLYAVPGRTLPLGDDGTGRFVVVTLDADGLPPRGSLAYKLGFERIDLKTIGPRR